MIGFDCVCWRYNKKIDFGIYASVSGIHVLKALLCTQRLGVERSGVGR